jgi:hypothetical protein
MPSSIDGARRPYATADRLLHVPVDDPIEVTVELGAQRASGHPTRPGNPDRQISSA